MRPKIVLLSGVMIASALLSSCGGLVEVIRQEGMDTVFSWEGTLNQRSQGIEYILSKKGDKITLKTKEAGMPDIYENLNTLTGEYACKVTYYDKTEKPCDETYDKDSFIALTADIINHSQTYPQEIEQENHGNNKFHFFKDNQDIPCPTHIPKDSYQTIHPNANIAINPSRHLPFTTSDPKNYRISHPYSDSQLNLDKR